MRRFRLPDVPAPTSLSAAALLLAACATRPIPTPTAEVLSLATVVAVRPVLPAGAVLSLLGASGNDVATGRQEVILRTEDGRIVSLVQAGSATLRPGQAVTLGGEPARLGDG